MATQTRPRSKGRAAAMQFAAVKAAIQAEEQPKLSSTCDCGERKGFSDEACSRCLYLDGGSTSDADLIALLRITPGGMSTHEIGVALDRDPNGLARMLSRLLNDGRLTKRWRELESVEAANGTGLGGERGCWAWSLSERLAA